MIKYNLEKVLEIISKKAKVNGELRYEIYSQENSYKLKLYDFVYVGCTIVKIPICTFSIDKLTYKIESAEHNYILVTKWNKRIVTTIGNLTCSIIDDFDKYIPREKISDEARIVKSVRNSGERDSSCSGDKLCDGIGNGSNSRTIEEGTQEHKEK